MQLILDNDDPYAKTHNLFQRLFLKHDKYTVEELDYRLNKLVRFCFSHHEDSYKAHIDRSQGLRVLKDLSANLDEQLIRNTHITTIFFALVSCMHNFEMRSKADGTIEYYSKRKLNRTMEIYETFLRKLSSKHFHEIFQAVITFCKESNMWYMDNICADILSMLLPFEKTRFITVITIIEMIKEEATNDVSVVKEMLIVLSHVLKRYARELDEKLINQLFMLYHESLLSDVGSNYRQLKTAFELSIQTMLSRLSNTTLLDAIKLMFEWVLRKEIHDDDMFELGHMLEFAAHTHRMALIKDSFNHPVFQLILEMISSNNRRHSLLGNRILHFLIDRNSNRTFFSTPMLFLKGTDYAIKVPKYNAEDKIFYKNHYKALSNCFLMAIRKHLIYRSNIESVYTSLALLVTEIPCAYVSSTAICIVLELQKFVLETYSASSEWANQIHALVIAVVSLICWIHKAEILYEYVNEILARRGLLAPHLNPPLYITYQYRDIDAISKDARYFFDEWEIMDHKRRSWGDGIIFSSKYLYVNYLSALNPLRSNSTNATQPQQSKWTRFLNYCYNPPCYTGEELDQILQKINQCCLSHNEDSYVVYLDRYKGLKLLEQFVKRVDAPKAQSSHITSAIWSILSCIHHFSVHLTLRFALTRCFDRHKVRRSLRVYEVLLELFGADRYQTVSQSVIVFCNESKMWYAQSVCTELFRRLINCNEGFATVQTLLNLVEGYSTEHLAHSRQLMRVLNNVLLYYRSSDMDEILSIRLLTMYHHSLAPSNYHRYDYTSLKNCLEVCIQNFLTNIPNLTLLNVLRLMLNWTLDEEISDEAILKFGSVMEYAAFLHKVILYRDSLHHEVFLLILRMIASANRLHSLLGNILLQQLLDRNLNRVHFISPRIFLEHTQYNIKIGTYWPEDKTFFKEYRDQISTSLVSSIEQHGIYRTNLESIYTTMVIFVTEIPCGYVAASIICTAMAIQEYVIKQEDMELEYSHRIHATVLAITSFICWVHKAKEFYEYVNAIVSRRAQQAPHLNPPLRVSYDYAQHHVLWNKPELFFEDWEVRYGLWKCFRSQKDNRDDGRDEETLLKKLHK